MPVKRLSTVLPIGLFFFVVAGCATAPQPAEGAGSGVGERAAQQAAQLVGKPYRYGGASPSTGFDCSGLVQWSYAQAGRKLPRSTDDQRTLAYRIKVSELRPGDLIFFQNTYTWGLSHVGIYIGNGQFIHAENETTGVVISNLSSDYYSSRWYGAVRLS